MNADSAAGIMGEPDRKLFEEPHIVQMLEGLTNGFSTFDEEWRFTFISPKCQQLFEIPDGMIGKRIWDELPLLKDTEFHAVALRALSQQCTLSTEEVCPYIRIWIESRIQPCRNGVVVYYRDISDRIEHHQGEARFFSILEATTDFVSVFDTHGKPPYLNRAGRQLIGLRDDEDLSQTNIPFHPTWASDLVLSEGIPAAIREGVWSGETALLTRDGREIPVSQVLIAHKNSHGEIEFISTIARDISDRKRTETRLQEQAALLDLSPNAIMVCDLEQKIVFWNKGAERVYGWSQSEVLGEDFCALLWPRETCHNQRQALQELNAQGAWRGELRCRTKDGRELINDCHWSVVSDTLGQEKSFLIINADITEKKKLEDQFLRAQRMESLGTLASGIAHDLNNILSPILLAVRILGLKFTDEDSQHLLGALRRSAERGADLVRQVLTYARGTDGEKITLDTRRLIRDVIRMLQDTFPKSITLKDSLPTGLNSIIGDPTQLYQVLMNLCVNARDAMPDGGTLSVSAQEIHFDEVSTHTPLEARPGDYVMIQVSDSGTGIPPEVRAKIFEPFFTTKVQGQGSGLGLATVLGIIRSHDGFIDFDTELGQGTSFKIYLPIAKSKRLPETNQENKEWPAAQGEMILIVDDEVEILSMTSNTLTSYGYRTLTANSGKEAVERYRQNMSAVQMVLIDLMMPEMDGIETIRELKQLNPDLKIITTSGLTDNQRLAVANALGANAYLVKPCLPEKMAQTIAAVLHAEKSKLVTQ